MTKCYIQLLSVFPSSVLYGFFFVLVFFLVPVIVILLFSFFSVSGLLYPITVCFMIFLNIFLLIQFHLKTFQFLLVYVLD